MIVLFPLPFSPARIVIPGGISRPPSAMICETAGMSNGHRSVSGGRTRLGDHSARSKCRGSTSSEARTTLFVTRRVVREPTAHIRLVHDAKQLATRIRRDLVAVEQVCRIDDEGSLRIPDHQVCIEARRDPSLVRVVAREMR